MKFNQRLATAVATAAVIMGAVAPAAFADTNVTIVGNGPGSSTNVSVSKNNGTNVVQNNSSVVVTEVNSSASTGGNHADFNVGGGTNITTGNATSNVTVNVAGSSNTANVTTPDCGCNTTTNVTVAGNGPGSHNSVGVSNNTWFNAFQNNWNYIITAVTSSAKTGKNTSSFNVGGGTHVTTSNGISNVTVGVGGASNTLNH